MVNAEPRRDMIYVVSFMGFYKIGRTSNIEQRMRSILPTAFPVDPTLEVSMEVPESVVAERLLHEYFSEKRIRGEWFSLDAQDVEQVPALVGKIDFHRQRFSNHKPKTQKQLSQLLTNKIALAVDAKPLRHAPSILCNLKPGRSVEIRTADRQVLRSIERKFRLKLWINNPCNSGTTIVTKVE